MKFALVALVILAALGLRELLRRLSSGERTRLPAAGIDQEEGLEQFRGSETWGIM